MTMSSLPDHLDRQNLGGRVDRLLSVEDVCDYLGLSRDFVYDQVRLGRLRGSRIARQLRFRRADVDAFVDLHMVEPLAPGPGPTRLPERGPRRAGGVASASWS